VIIRGPQAEAERWRDELAVIYAPRRLVFAIPDDAPELPSALAEKRGGPQPVAYVCRGMTCSAPLTSLEQLVDELGNSH
jgi:uncharacterized protein YyaL (SSP411 family)